jgi:hypothetical protein
MNKQENWKEQGFGSEEEYKEFLRIQKDKLMSVIMDDPKLLNVLKRLNDK